MLFQTTQFLAFFFFFYVLFLSLKNQIQYRLLLLTVASYIFYAHWDWRFLGLIVFSTVADYLLGQMIEDSKDQRRKKRLLIYSLVLNLSVLGFFKYFNFFLTNLYSSLKILGVDSPHWSLNIILPVGVSFYTFESMSYIIDIYRGDLKASRRFLEYSVFISFFPHLVAGPIIRPRSFFKQIQEPIHLSKNEFHQGMIRFGIGVLKKVFLADLLALHWVDPVFDNPSQYTGLDHLIAMYAYAFQIYLDFSAYSDMAIGLSKACGIHLPENFNYPYLARNFQDFWNRWHISLSTWLRDYLYIPLGGNRKGPFKQYLNIMITMVLGGLWHGADLSFVLWGFIHGIFISASHFAKSINMPKMPDWILWLLTFNAVSLAWIFFRTPSSEAAFNIIGRIIRLEQFPATSISMTTLLILSLSIAGHLSGKCSLKFKFISRLSLRPTWQIMAFYSLVFISIVIGEQHFHPFIYFQF